MGEQVTALRTSSGTWSRSTFRPISWGRSPVTRLISKWPNGSAACSPSRACSAWPGRRNGAGEAPHPGSKPPSVRRCGRTTNLAAPSTWGSTGWDRRSCGTAHPSSSAAPAGDRPGRGHLVPGLQRTERRLRPGFAADRGPAGRGRLADVGPEDLDVVRHHGPVVFPSGPHVEGGKEAAGPHRSSWCRCRTRRSRFGRSIP